MFQVAVIIIWICRILDKVPGITVKAPSAKQVEQGLKHFETIVKGLLGIFATLWILFIVATVHLLKTIWRFK